MLFPEIVPGALITVHSSRAFAVYVWPSPDRKPRDAFVRTPFYDGIVLSRLDDAENTRCYPFSNLPILVLCSRTMRIGWVSVYEVRVR